ncbi:hypothetical protein BH09ACT13_BH09ACT13_10040 [soil metagenome]
MAVTETGLVASRELDSLYRRHGGEIYRYALAVLGNHADAEDVTQTTFLNAYRALEQGVRPRKPINWLLTIASNVVKERFRHDQARPRQVALDRELASTPAEDDAPTVGELLTALSKIPPQQRQAIVLREFEGRSYKEIADILGITTAALETLLFRARRSLAEELAHQLSCTEAQQAVSRAADGRLGRKERRRLREHLTECPDCSQFARLLGRHRKALRGLALIPIPVSLSLFKGLEGSAAAAALPISAAATVGGGVGVGGAATATGGGIFAGGLAVKAAAVVAAAGVAGGATVAGVKEIEKRSGSDSPPAARTTKSGKVVPVRDHGESASDRAKARRRAIARGRTGLTPPGLVNKAAKGLTTPNRGRAADAKAKSARPATPRRAGPKKATGASARSRIDGRGRSTADEKPRGAEKPRAAEKPAKVTGRARAGS